MRRLGVLMAISLAGKAFDPLHRIDQRQNLVKTSGHTDEKHKEDKGIEIGIGPKGWSNAGIGQIAQAHDPADNGQHGEDLTKRLRELRRLISADMIHICGPALKF